MEGFNYKDYDALGLAELVKKGEIQPLDLVEEAIRLTDSLNPKMNAVINKMYDKARKTAGQQLTGQICGSPDASQGYFAGD